MSMHRVVICLGSNVDDAELRIGDAIRYLSHILFNLKASSVYPTPGEGEDSTGNYFNAVVIAQTDSSSDDLTMLLKHFEQLRGRNAENRSKGIVPIDLDLVFYDNVLLREKEFGCRYFKIGYSELSESDVNADTKS